MSKYTNEERYQSTELTGLGTRPSQVWTKPPIPIATPSNNAHDPLKHSAASKYNLLDTTAARKRAAKSDATFRDSKPWVGNVPAKAVLSRQHPKAGGGPMLDRSSARGRVQRESKVSEARDKEIYEIVDSEDEDTGKRVSPSSDEMNIGHKSFTSKGTRNAGDRTTRALEKPPSSFGPRRPAPDGASTARLLDELRNDPITQFDSDSDLQLVTKPQEKNVKSMVSHYEKLHGSSNPAYLDLEHERRKKIKAAMKPKSQQLKITPIVKPNEDPLTSITSYTKPRSDQRPKSQFKSLPIEAACIGLHKSEDGDEIELLWKPSEDMVLNYKIASCNEQLSFRLTPHDIKSLEYTAKIGNKPIDPAEPFLMFIFSSPDAPIGQVIKSAFPGKYDTVDHQQGLIALKFNKSDGRDSKDLYSDFTTWLKMRHPSVSYMRPLDAKNVWNQSIELTTKLPASPQTLRKRARSLDTTNDDVPTKVRLHEDTSDIISSAQEHTSAPPRPKPRPAHRIVKAESPSEGVRRSTRNTTQPPKTPSPPVDLDEVILVYPPGTTGAVNITNGDLRRLQPGEFLNDTLIEFGLKRWLKGLEDTQPELAKQIHVFSSFFYKKLNKKNLEEGFESVKKWTSKLKLFEKKYLIVPINENLHWYLAIIYHPEYVLQPPDPTPIRTNRSSARNTTKSPTATDPIHRSKMDMDVDESVSTTTPAPAESANSTIVPELSSTQDADMTDEEELARNLTNTFTGSCSISASPTHHGELAQKLLPAVDSAPDHAEGSGHLTRSPSISDFERKPAMNEMASATSAVDVDTAMASPKSDPSKLFDDDTGVELASVSRIAPIAAESFYAQSSIKTYQSKATTSKGKGKAPEDSAVSMDIDHSTEEEEVEVTDPLPTKPKTYIFTLDSLGSGHPKAIKVLAKYMMLEAKDKLGYDLTSAAQGKQAHVPFQPNYCDCGIYLLHFVETFMSNPDEYCQKILSRSRSRTAQERQADWNESNISDMRQVLKCQILSLSEEWKRERAVKEDAKKKEAVQKQTVVIESSEDEVDIVESATVVKKTRSRKGGKASSTPGPSRSR